jgi:hypothetical protein
MHSRPHTPQCLDGNILVAWRLLGDVHGQRPEQALHVDGVALRLKPLDQKVVDAALEVLEMPVRGRSVGVALRV